MASSAHQDRQASEEATMAEITFNTAHQEERVREQIKTAVAAYREMLDTFVGDRIRRVAAEAEQVRPPSIKTR
jgi:ABC-type enterochelin transport system substrate-binding protein